mmetsp:Transcript_24859/g.81335  ORF Transcript_24859/g.81335 Transcript_24859/m.81335 type:complete len:219 (-) Transcript_24859:582-1238(-)
MAGRRRRRLSDAFAFAVPPPPPPPPAPVFSFRRRSLARRAASLSTAPTVAPPTPPRSPAASTPDRNACMFWRDCVVCPSTCICCIVTSPGNVSWFVSSSPTLRCCCCCCCFPRCLRERGRERSGRGDTSPRSFSGRSERRKARASDLLRSLRFASSQRRAAKPRTAAWIRTAARDLTRISRFFMYTLFGLSVGSSSSPSDSNTLLTSAAASPAPASSA